MPWSPDYVELDDVKHALRITDDEDDVELGAAITAASRAIDDYTHRQFGKTDAAEIRIYPDVEAGGESWERPGVLEIDDLASTTGIAIGVDEANDGTYSTVYTLGTEARLWPLNAQVAGRPWTELRTLGSRRFPRQAGAVRIEAQWGWAAVPALVKQACMVEAIRLFKRKDAPFGVAGSSELGGAEPLRLLARLDPDVELMLAGLRRRWLVR